MRAVSLLSIPLLVSLLAGRAEAAEYAPYFYAWGWGQPAYSFQSLVELWEQSGLRAVTLAFVLAEGGCGASRDIDRHLADVKAFRKRGGRVRASFGGARGASLEVACPDAGALSAAMGAFVERTGIVDLDFDVEQAAAMAPEVSRRRAEALARLQADKGITVSFTLPASPAGLSPAALEVIKAAVPAGLAVARVNLMTMSYAPVAGKAMSDLAITSLGETKKQLQRILPGLGEQDAWARLGVTPMIGDNGPSSMPFTLSDARALTRFVREKGVGHLSFWAIQRDRPGAGPLSAFRGGTEGAFAFHRVFADVTR